MSEFTAKNYPISRAPNRIELLGDKTKRPEPAQHIIEFPGGAIEVTRTTDGNYWAHILIHRGADEDWHGGRTSVKSRVIDSRIGMEYGHGGILSIQNQEHVEQIAVLIERVKE